MKVILTTSALATWLPLGVGTLLRDELLIIVTILRLLSRVFPRKMSALLGTLGTGRARWLTGLAAYASWYIVRCARLPKLTFNRVGASDRLKSMLAACPSMSKRYWPTFWAPTDMLQMSLTGLWDLATFTLMRPRYQRELVRLPDGQDAALDWLEPPAHRLRDGPVLVCLHGAFLFGSRTSQIVHLAWRGVALGLPVAAPNRRGYGGVKLSSAHVSLLGSAKDLDEMMLAVAKRYPGRSVALIGFSGGSTQAVRYAVDRGCPDIGSEQDSSDSERDSSDGPCVVRRPKVLCAVGIDYAFDLSGDGTPNTTRPLFDKVLALAMFFSYGFRHRHTLQSARPEALESLTPKNTILRKNSGRLAVEALRFFADEELQQDDEKWRRFNAPDLCALRVPCLLISSADDPICTQVMTERYRSDMESSQCVVHVEMRRGGHGGKFPFTGVGLPLFVDLSMEFVLAACATVGAEQTLV